MSRNTERPAGIRSSIGHLAPMFREEDPANGLRAAGEMWKLSEGDFLVVRLSSLRSWADRKAAELLGERLYGEIKKDAE